jgi:hypothetical protein
LFEKERKERKEREERKERKEKKRSRFVTAQEDLMCASRA